MGTGKWYQTGDAVSCLSQKLFRWLYFFSYSLAVFCFTILTSLSDRRKVEPTFYTIFLFFDIWNEIENTPQHRKKITMFRFERYFVILKTSAVANPTAEELQESPTPKQEKWWWIQKTVWSTPEPDESHELMPCSMLFC